VVGRRSRQKEADVSSTVIFLLALKDHVETRDHLLASERASERARVRAPWGRGDSTLSLTPSVLPGKLPVASIHPGVALCARAPVYMRFRPPRAQYRTVPVFHATRLARLVRLDEIASQVICRSFLLSASRTRGTKEGPGPKGEIRNVRSFVDAFPACAR